MAEKKKRGITFPHMFTLILLIIAVCTILTYVVPAGEYDTYVDDNGVEVFVDGSYHRVEQTPVTPMKALMSVQEGIIETANIAAFIFVIGGAFGVVAETKAIEAGIGRIIKKTSKRQGLLIPIMIFVVGFGAGSFGMFEECLVFIPFLVPICIAMGYDSITGLAVAIVGSSSGYAGSFVQPANVGVSQLLRHVVPPHHPGGDAHHRGGVCVPLRPAHQGRPHPQPDVRVRPPAGGEGGSG